MYLGKEVHVLLKGSAKDCFLELKKRQDKEAQILIRSIERIILMHENVAGFKTPPFMIGEEVN